VDARIQQVNQKVDGEIQLMLRAVETEYKVARAREDTLLNNVNQLSREGQALSEKEIQYLALQRESESNQQLYDAVLKRLKETGVTGGLETNNVRVVEEASVPTTPVRPQKARSLLISVVIGFVLAVGVALGIDYFDTTLKTPDDVERYLGLSAVGLVPRFSGASVPATARKKRSLPLLVTEIAPKSAAAEAYRTLRTNIEFAALDEPRRSLVVTSAIAGEGKTTTVANLGIAAAQAGSRVCLVDSDLRRPALHRLFDLPNDRGLTTAVVEGVPFAQVAQATRIPNLTVLPSGPIPPNPAELAGSKRMGELLRGATSDFDLILCDTPPVISVADGVALAAQADGVIIVVRVGTVPHDVLRRAIDQVDAVQGRMVGVLLNNVDLRRDGYGYTYYRYYRSYHGGDDGKRSAA
jgi:polysaccharide biosynthesis transport protein